MKMIIEANDGKMESIELTDVPEDKKVADKDFDNICLLFAKNLSNVTGSDKVAIETFEKLLAYANKVNLKLANDYNSSEANNNE